MTKASGKLFKELSKTQDNIVGLEAGKFVLCYVEEDFQDNAIALYFCNKDSFKEVWGDDWSDSPFEHNAGTPYSQYDIIKVLTHDLERLEIDIPYLDKNVSVKEINNDRLPWAVNRSKKSKKTYFPGDCILDVVHDIKSSCMLEDIEAIKYNEANHENIEYSEKLRGRFLRAKINLEEKE